MLAKRRAGRKWTAEDDKKVAELVGIHGTHKWSFIGSLCGRNGKQCRERWHNQLDPSINKAAWSVEEERILRDQHAILGNKWAKISKFLPGVGPGLAWVWPRVQAWAWEHGTFKHMSIGIMESVACFWQENKYVL